MNSLQDIQRLLSFSLTPGQVISNLVVALGYGLMISYFYRRITHRLSNGRTFVSALILLNMITAIVIMVIGNNLARAFGLVGAMSIIRFRTAVKDVRDIVFIFFSLAIGMAAGVGLLGMAFISTTFIGLVAVAVSYIQVHGQKRRDYLLQFIYTPQPDTEAPYLPVFAHYCRQYYLVNSKMTQKKLELSFYVHLKDQQQSNAFVQALAQMDEVQRVNLFFDEEYDE